MPYNVTVHSPDNVFSFCGLSENYTLFSLRAAISKSTNILEDSIKFSYNDNLILSPETNMHRCGECFDISDSLKVIITERDETRMSSQRRLVFKLYISVGFTLGIIVGATGYLSTHELAALWFIGSIFVCSSIGAGISHIKQKNATPILKSPEIWPTNVKFYKQSEIFRHLNPADKEEFYYHNEAGCNQRDFGIRWGGCQRYYIKDILSKIHDGYSHSHTLYTRRSATCVVTQDIYNAFYKLVLQKNRKFHPFFWKNINHFLDDLADNHSDLLTQGNIVNFFKIHEDYLLDAINNIRALGINQDAIDSVITKYSGTPLTDRAKNLLSRGYYREFIFSHKEYNPVQMDAEIDEFAKITKAYLK